MGLGKRWGDASRPAVANSPWPGRDAVRRILSTVTWPYVLGFGLCQTWNILCVALRDPVTYGEPFLDLRWVSLATALTACVAVAFLRARAERWIRSRALLLAAGVVASASSLLGPISALFPPVSAVLIYLAAVGVGFGFAWLFLVWYAKFCDARDMMGLACSVAANVLFTYPLANVLATDQISPWIAAAVGSALPLMSVGLALSRPAALPACGDGRRGDDAGMPCADGRVCVVCEGEPGDTPAIRRKMALRFAACLFIVAGIVETARNLLLGGTALVFYAGVANLGGATLKVACAMWLVAVFDARDARGVSLVYRLSFVLLLGVVLCTPFLLQGNWFAHMLLDVSSFFFQLTMLMVSYQITIGFGMRPSAVFGAMRGVWAAAALAGIVVGDALWHAMAPQTIQLLAVVLGLLVALAFVFVFTDRDCVKVLASMPAEEGRTPRFRARCGQIAQSCGISERELEVMMLTAKGRSAARIAEDLGVTLATVNSHVHHIYQKMGVHSRQELLDAIEGDDGVTRR